MGVDVAPQLGFRGLAFRAVEREADFSGVRALDLAEFDEAAGAADHDVAPLARTGTDRRLPALGDS